jgi:hypothetical protein
MLCFVVMLYPGPVQATGVGVSPHRLEVEVNPAGLVSSSISVVNTSDEESLYQVYIEGEDLSSWFHISPWEFGLDPGRCQDVQIDISPPAMASGEYKTNVCVVGLVHNSDLKVGCGVKVPISIRILPSGLLGKVSGTSLMVIIVFVATPLAAVVFYRKRRKTHVG